MKLRGTKFLDSLESCLSSSCILPRAVTDLFTLHNSLENSDSNEHRRHTPPAERGRAERAAADALTASHERAAAVRALHSLYTDTGCKMDYFLLFQELYYYILFPSLCTLTIQCGDRSTSVRPHTVRYLQAQQQLKGLARQHAGPQESAKNHK